MEETTTKERKPRARGNGQGTAFKRGNTWTAQVTIGITKDENGKIIKRQYRTKGGFKTKREALAYCNELLHGTPTSPTITFTGLYELWSKEHYSRISKDAENGYKAAYAKCGALYARQFAGLKTFDLQKVVDDAKSLKGEPLSARAKADIKSLYNNMYKYALQNDYTEKDYAQYVVLPKKEKSKKDAFTQAEIDKLFEDYNNGNDFTGYILIMIYTGMRYGEISTIKKANVHLAEHYMVGGIKTEAGIDREIPICDKIFPIVEKFYNQGKKKLLEIHEKVFYNNFYVTLERLGIRKMAPHCCRHTTATALANADIAPAIIIAILGHEDYATTLKNYTHIKLDEMLDAINKI